MMQYRHNICIICTANFADGLSGTFTVTVARVNLKLVRDACPGAGAASHGPAA